MNANLFLSQFEDEAISRIQKFAKIASSLDFQVAVGFSGGKDSQVIYDLCKRANIEFKAYFNHSFESSVTLNFIREHYPDVIWRRDHKFGFIENIWKNHNSLLPTVEIAYCCRDYKHNPLYVDNASIVGVRREESLKRKFSKTFEAKNKSTLRNHLNQITPYFNETCLGVGSPSIIQLKPIVDWTEDDVWNYINTHNLPRNPEYESFKRIGCIICPKANFTSNYKSLMQHPKLVNAIIKARKKRTNIDWIIQTDNADYSNDKCYYICRWLNHSFRGFTKRQEALYQDFRQYYDSLGLQS